MADAQHVRVTRRKLIDRLTQVGDWSVEGHEPYEVPNTSTPERIHVAVVTGPNRIVAPTSTLAYSAQWFSFVCHFFKRLPLSEPQMQERIDPELSDARDTCIAKLHDGISYGSGVELDPTGKFGDPLRGEPGYLDQEGTKFRTETMTVGFIAFNAFEQIRT